MLIPRLDGDTRIRADVRWLVAHGIGLGPRAGGWSVIFRIVPTLDSQATDKTSSRHHISLTLSAWIVVKGFKNQPRF
jgi:hypothetical protein